MAKFTIRPPTAIAVISRPSTAGGDAKRRHASMKMNTAVTTSVAAFRSVARISTRW